MSSKPTGNPNGRPRLTFDIRPLAGWEERALCAETDPALFFPGEGASPSRAKKVCAACPVRLQCLETAVENEEMFGIFGGLTERERRPLRRLRKAS